nr:hypothetical protein [Qaidamihabitans albus]
MLLGAGAAQAAQPGRSVQAEPNAMTFGLLGPVGLAAVVLGVLGMAAGVARQRRRARAAEPAGAEMAAMAEAVLAEEPARRTPA